jgi:hypothetical protein
LQYVVPRVQEKPCVFDDPQACTSGFPWASTAFGLLILSSVAWIVLGVPALGQLTPRQASNATISPSRIAGAETRGSQAIEASPIMVSPVTGSGASRGGFTGFGMLLVSV